MSHRPAALATLVLLLGTPFSLADAPSGYYATVEGTTGDALKAALNKIIDGHTRVPYSSSSFDTADAMEVLDVDPENPDNVILFYSGRSEPKANFGMWNREHLWPRSYGIGFSGVDEADLHNLRPADASVNSSRSNDFYDDSDTSDPGFVSPAHPEAPWNTSDTDSWEPPDSRKGDVARALFYMVVRYEGATPFASDLELTDDVSLLKPDMPIMGKLTTLILWHLLDPPDAADMARNDGIFTLYQGNRNPFIDRPEWVLEVFGNPLDLAMDVTDSGMLLSWSSDLHRVELQESRGLSAWLPVDSEPINSGGRAYVLEPVAGRKFYRLGVK